MRWYHLLLTTCVPAFYAAAACDTGDDAAILCDAGSNVFCRCRGGGAGTKQCNAAGDGFGGCETDTGTCEEIKDDPDNPTGAGGGVPKPAEPGTFLGHCDETISCPEGQSCPMGYCTKPCTSFEDCGDGDCVMWESGAICMPYCIVQDDCQTYSMASKCGYTDQAVPPFETLVCADWGDNLQLPPDGFAADNPCNNDHYCNLGFTQRERVCSIGGCTDGCHVDSDCSETTETCTSEDGVELGTCTGGMTTENGDDCPGIPLTITLANPDVSVDGDTEDAFPPSEHACDSPCVASMNPPSEELVYALTISGASSCSFSTPCTLTALLQTSDSTYDPQLYVRELTCADGAQLTYSDEIGGGVSEIMEWSVFNNETHWIIVDGWQGSAGAFQLDLNLSQ